MHNKQIQTAKIQTLIDELIRRFNARRAAGLGIAAGFWEGNFADVPAFGDQEADATRKFLAGFQLDPGALLQKAQKEFEGVDDRDLELVDVRHEAATMAAEGLKATLMETGMTNADATGVATRIVLAV